MEKRNMRTTARTLCGIGATVILTVWTAPTAAEVLRAEAVAGSPFGVGQIVVRAGDVAPETLWNSGDADLVERQGRLFYPVHATGPVRQILRDLIRTRGNFQIFFLFKGDAPLELTFYTPQPVRVQLRPQPYRRGPHTRLLNNWWREYTRGAERRARSSEYPSMVDAYLTSTLARRLSLRPPLYRPGLLQGNPNEGWGLVLGGESVRLRIQRETLAGQLGGNESADLPLPADVRLPPLAVPQVGADVAVETIAKVVPQECYYIRFGNWSNYVWISTLVENWGGELRNMILERGIDYGLNARSEDQLGLKETALSRALGDTLISDVAIIGTDPFLREGGAFGMLFEAKNNFLLATSIRQQRATAMAKTPDSAKEEEVLLAGRKVSFAHTPDGSLRSYYVAVGNYHLVTTSRKIVRRFIEASNGQDSLGGSREFRYARTVMPVSRDDTIFAYMSDAFFRNLASAHYRIEMARRLRSITDIDSFRLARLAAAAENQPARSVEELIRGNLLPRGFGERSDGSRMVVAANHISDSLRGEPGSFVPVPDVKIKGVTRSEARAYERFAQQYANAASQMAPVIVAIKRTATQTAGVERLEIEARLTPVATPLFRRLAQYLGAPRKTLIGRLEDDLIRIDGVGQQENYIYFGLQEFNLSLAIRGGRVRFAFPDFKVARGYLGGLPGLGWLAPYIELPFGVPGPPDGAGFARTSAGLWYWFANGMTTVSFNRTVLESVTPRLAVREAIHPAQMRVHIADLTNTGLGAGVKALGYQHAMDVSVGNVALLQSLIRQLRVPSEKSHAVAEKLLGAKLVCSLGGRYELRKENGRRSRWVSTAWEGGRPLVDRVPEDYMFPVMQWFRGFSGSFESRRDMLTLRTVALMQTKKKNGGFLLPKFEHIDTPPPEPEGPVPEELPLPKIERGRPVAPEKVDAPRE